MNAVPGPRPMTALQIRLSLKEYASNGGLDEILEPLQVKTRHIAQGGLTVCPATDFIVTPIGHNS
jgi:hypothetical protein